jgi:anti-anti-sigma regulatory factor
LRADYDAIVLRGYLGIERYPEFRDAFRSADGDVPTLVDLREGTGADSLFLSELLLFRRRHGARLAVLIPPSGNLARIFAVAGMNEKMNVYDELEAALRALGLAADR